MLPLLTTESTNINYLCHNKLYSVCYCIWVLHTAGSYANIVPRNGVDKL